MNATNWPAPNVWFVTAQMVKHCIANTEAMGSNQLKSRNLFRVNLQLLKLQLPLRRLYSKFSRHMRNMDNAAEHFMFFKWQSKFGVKNKGTILFTNHFDLG